MNKLIRFINISWNKRGNPVEIGLLTFGLLIVPYLEFVIFIAPIIDRYRIRQLNPKYLPLVILILLIGLIGVVVAQEFKTNKIRKVLKKTAIFIITARLVLHLITLPSMINMA